MVTAAMMLSRVPPDPAISDHRPRIHELLICSSAR
jgi:hypothetical protein